MLAFFSGSILGLFVCCIAIYAYRRRSPSTLTLQTLSGLIPSLLLATELSWSSSLQASNAELEPIEVAGGKDSLPLGRKALFLFDSEGRYTAEDVSQGRYDQEFTPSPTDVRSFGLTMATVWMKFTLRNSTGNPLSLIFENRYSNHAKNQLYVIDAHGNLEMKDLGGLHSPFDTRPIQSRFPATPLVIPPGDSTYIFKMVSVSAILAAPYLHTHEAMTAQEGAQLVVMGIVFGTVLIMGLYNLGLYVLYRQLTFIYFGIHCLCNFLFFLSMEGILQKLIFSDGDYSGVSKIVWNTFIVGVILDYTFFTSAYLNLKERMPRIHKGMLFVAFLLFLLIPMGYVNHFYPVVLFAHMGPFMALSGIIVGLFGAFRRDRNSIFYLISVVPFLIGAVTFALAQGGKIESNVFTVFAFYIGGSMRVAFISFSVGDKMRQIEVKAKAQMAAFNEQLEKTVKIKTTEIRALLDYIPQGVFSVGLDLKVSPEYSAHLPKILETEDIARKSFSELILDRSALSSDVKDQIVQVLAGSIGEDELSFATNSHLLPAEVDIMLAPDKLKALALTWNIECEAGGEVRKVLITALDVTESKNLQKVAEARQAELQTIKELVDCGAEKFAQFSTMFDQIMAESENLLHAEPFDMSSVKILFVNAHTAKGSARTLGLSKLSTVIHENENLYTLLLQNKTELDLPHLTADLQLVRNVFLDYSRVNRDILGRANDLSQVKVSRQFLFEHCQFMLSLENGRLESADKAVVDLIHSNCDEFIKLITNSLEFILEDILKHSARVAKDLERPAPRLALNVMNIQVTQSLEETLRKSLLHIIRNSLDHGIEPPAIRTQKGKAPEGTIFVEARAQGPELVLSISDDGQGLAIGRLLEMGKRNNTLTDESPLQEIANSIFNSGVSTARTVSMISGRGVGMSAIKQFVEELGGRVDIVIKEKIDTAEGFYKFEILMSFDLESSTITAGSASFAESPVLDVA